MSSSCYTVLEEIIPCVVALVIQQSQSFQSALLIVLKLIQLGLPVLKVTQRHIQSFLLAQPHLKINSVMRLLLCCKQDDKVTNSWCTLGSQLAA